jgi:DNA-directed RNA polymerase specialized sigma24 family protein
VPDTGPPATAEGAVTALDQAHAPGLIRLACLMLGDRAAAGDVVQEAFRGLHRRWSRLDRTGRAVGCLRTPY